MCVNDGGSEAMYTPEGPAGNIDVLLTFERGMFRTAGVEFLRFLSPTGCLASRLTSERDCCSDIVTN